MIFTDCYFSLEETNKHYQNQYANSFNWRNYAESLIESVRFAVTPRTILDFGSGSGLLADALISMGYLVDTYEPMLHGDFKAEKYSNCYDLVILNEVVEHLVDVISIFDCLYSVIRPGGIMYIGTLMTDAMMNEPIKFQQLFSNWWYKDDQTHVSFFCQLTFEYICEMKSKYQLQMLSVGSSGVILQRV